MHRTWYHSLLITLLCNVISDWPAWVDMACIWPNNLYFPKIESQNMPWGTKTYCFFHRAYNSPLTHQLWGILRLARYSFPTFVYKKLQFFLIIGLASLILILLLIRRCHVSSQHTRISCERERQQVMWEDASKCRWRKVSNLLLLSLFVSVHVLHVTIHYKKETL